MHYPEITSPQNPYIKHLTLLRTDKKTRQEHQAFVVSGVKLITDLSQKFPIKTLLIDSSYTGPISVKAEKILRVPLNLLQKITGLASPEAFVAEIAFPHPPSFPSIDRLLILDSISDPGNLGTLLRTATCLNWTRIFLTGECTDLFNDKTLRAAQGAHLYLQIQQGSYEELFALLKKESLSLLIASADGAPCTSFPPPPKIALALGNETRGPSPELLSRGTPIGIPISSLESLNVASAGAILMYQLGSHV